MRFNNLMICACLLGLISCEQEKEHTIVQGYVKTYGSETVHEGIEVELIQEGVGFVLLDRTVSNADGWYQLEGDFTLGEIQYLYLSQTPDLHRPFRDDGYKHLKVKSGGVQKVDIEIQPYSWVNIHFKNVEPCNQYDVISFTGGLGSVERIYGDDTDEFFLWRTTGNKEVVFNYNTLKCYCTHSFESSFGYVAAFDTVDFEVFY
jgi:hypothetical protein